MTALFGLAIFCVLFIVGQTQVSVVPCTDPEGVDGVCLSIRDCPPILDQLVEQQFNLTFIDYIHQSNALCHFRNPYICCPFPTVSEHPKAPSANLLSDPEGGCGWNNVTLRRVVGGVPANMGSWPWMALLGYQDSFGDVSFKCGGSLITARHLLTAAHCDRKNLVSARLGEHDTSTDTETQHIDISILRIVQHPDYDKRDGHSDIAVIFLAEVVDFTPRIHPICLPHSEPQLSKNYVDYNPFIAGWGRTEEGGQIATVLQEAQVRVFANEECQNRFRMINKVVSAKQFDEAVLCAGDLAGNKDSCQGDSGGPLMAPEIIGGNVFYYQIGVVSYGIGCARENLPAVYTNVQHFTDWIEATIQEQV